MNNNRVENRVEYSEHIGVMQNEVNSIINKIPDGVFIDATYGYGSHFKIIKKNFTNLQLIGFDRDSESILNSNDNVHKLNFSEIPNYLKSQNINKISGIFYDFGVSSHQIDNPGRGFSYMKEGPLDMRMDSSLLISANDLVNNYSYEDLLDIFYKFSGEKDSNLIARKIIENRPIISTLELKEVIKSSLKYKNPNYLMSAVKRVFQAIRIYVNKEISEIEDSLSGVADFIMPNGVIICISYHSLEDRVVKSFFSNLTKGCTCDPKFAICICNNQNKFEYGDDRKFLPTKSEVNTNKRSSSAILRYVVKNEN